MTTHRAVRAGAAAALAATALPVAVAFAHAEVKSVTPSRSSTVRHAVRNVHVTFEESVVTGTISITRSGKAVPMRSAGLKPSNHAVLRGVPRSALKAGRYRVSWRALSDDGHREHGSWSFRVR